MIRFHHNGVHQYESPLENEFQNHDNHFLQQGCLLIGFIIEECYNEVHHFDGNCYNSFLPTQKYQLHSDW